jgi:hypothetical protein
VDGSDGAFHLLSNQPSVNTTSRIAATNRRAGRLRRRKPIDSPIIPSSFLHLEPARPGGDADGVGRAWIGDAAGVSSRGLFRAISLFHLQPICNCFGLIFLRITCSCFARERTTVSVWSIRIPIAVALSPVSANLRSLSSSACVHGREATSVGCVIDPCAPRIKADHRAFEVAPSLHAGKQQVNTRKPPVRIRQLSNCAAAADGVIGFRLIDRAEVAVRQKDGTD